MESVDKLFGADIIDEIDKKTPDGDLGLGTGAADSPDEGEEIVMLDDESLAELFDGSTPFDDAFGGADASSDGGMGFSGIGSAEDDDEGVPVPEAALEANGKKKKDKRTARSQAHAKKNKARQQDMPESGIFAEDEEFEEEPGFPEEGIGDNGDLPHGDDGEVFPLTPASRKSKKAKKAQGTSESKRKGASISYDDSDGEEGSPNASRHTASAEASSGYAGLPDENGEEEWDDEYDDGHGDYDEYEQVDLPDWADSIRRKVNANVAHAFLLNGNVRDYMVRNISIKDGIVAVLDGECENFDVIAEYDQAHGISFYGDDIEIRDGRMLADAYKERFIEEMHESQERLSLPQTEEIPNRDPVMLFTILSDMFDHPSKTRKAKILLFIDYSDLLVPDASSAQMKPDERKLAITLADIGRSQAADDAGNVMIFITDDMTQLSTRIRSAESRIEQIKIPIPDRAERADFIDNVLDVPENTLSDGTQVFEHEDSISKEAFAINSAGLSRIQIEDIMLRALSEDEPLSMQLMKERKQEIIKEDYDDVLEIIDPKTGFERVGGMELLKQTFVEEVIEPVHAGEHEAVPMGQLLMGPPGSGKSCSIYSLIYKEDGPVLAKDIRVGDRIFSRDGKLHEVLGVFPQGKLPAYEVEFADGRKVICSEDHIWTVRYKNHGRYVEENKTVKEMLEHGLIDISPADIKTGRTGHTHYFVPQCSPVEFPEKKLSVPPYVMGAFLGDGTGNSTNIEMTCSEMDIDIIENMSELLGLPYKSIRKKDIHWTFIKEFSEVIGGRTYDSLLQTRELFKDYPEVMCYAYDKRIPDDYKYGSVEQRYALLQGLMDTDGSINQGTDHKRYNVRFSSTSKQLAQDIIHVANSLGYSCTLHHMKRSGAPISGSQERWGKQYYHQHDLYEVKFNIPNEEKHKLFRCKRKQDIALEAAKYHKKRHYEHIGIKDIHPLGRDEEMVCFMVDSPDHTYLVNDYSVTHNTMLCKAVAKEAGMNFVALNLNRIMEKWVGSTERNLDRALDCALAMSPTIIFIDEIDEALPNRADPNASSVNKRINQRLLTFFSDTSHRGEVIILAATNYPEKIDPAFKRAGRFDVRVPMFAPDEFDRMRIMRAIAAGRGYSFSWFEDPDDIVDNPFCKLKDWLHAGNVPMSDDRHFVGDLEMYSYTIKDALGNDERHDVYVPVRTLNILDKEKITLQQLYENVRILMPDLPQRQPDASTGEIDTDEVYQQNIMDYIRSREDILGTDDRNMKNLFVRIWKWEQVYSTFVDQTFRMTGAEMDVIMNKAINLYKKWKRKIGPEKVQKAIAAHVMKSDHDIPWSPFLLEACKRTVSASSGIKQMEDMALINTSDTDFIPDAMYAQLDDGRVISYRERHEELIARQEKSTLG